MILEGGFSNESTYVVKVCGCCYIVSDHLWTSGDYFGMKRCSSFWFFQVLSLSHSFMSFQEFN